MIKKPNGPAVSIIIPTYNGERYLRSIIKTITPYYNKGFEIILVDDGSEENDQTLNKFSVVFPNAICTRQDNGGVAKARNTGVSLATGDYIQLLDIDDSIAPEKLEIQYTAAIKNKADVVYSDWCMRTVDPNGSITQEPLVKSNIQPDYSDHIEALLERWWNPPHSYLISKKAYMDIGGGDEQLVNAQDFDVFIRLAIKGYRFHYVPGLYTYYYRYINANSLARGPRERYWRDTEQVVNKSISLLDKSKNLKKEYKRAAAQRLFLVARNAYKIDRNWGKNIFSKIKNLDPDFFPKYESKKFNFLFKLIGYPRAENVVNKLKF